MSVSMIRRTSNPAEYNEVDAVIVDERRPPAGISGIGGVVAVVGEFEKGPVDEIVYVGNLIELESIFGGMGLEADGFYKGRLSLVGKQFGRLGVVRVSNATQAAAAFNIEDDGPADIATATAKYVGKWGNALAVSSPAQSGATFNLDITDNGRLVEHWVGINTTLWAAGANMLPDSIYITLTKVADGVPDVAWLGDPLVGGLDGTFADADYTQALDVLKGPNAAEVRYMYVAEYSTSVVNLAVQDLCTTLTAVKRSVVSGIATQSKSAAITDAANYISDKVGYAYPPVSVFVEEANLGAGGLVEVQPNSFAINIISRIPPGRNPAGPNGEPYMTAIRDIKDKTLTLADYTAFRTAGIMGVQRTRERQSWSFRSGITSSIDKALKNWARRTIADWIQEGTAIWLTSFQNAVINRDLKTRIKGAIESFLDRQIVDGLLPSEEDLAAFRRPDDPRLRTYEVDMVSGNTPEAEAQGRIVVIVRVRIFSTADFIVFRTEIGEQVVITEQSVRTAA